MRKWITLLLCLQLFNNNVLGAELSKVSSLLNHFREHQQRGEKIDFAEFLFLHYGNTAHQQSEPLKHRSLPLHHNISTGTPTFNLTESVLSPQITFSIVTAKWNTPPVYFVQIEHTTDVFHPPQQG